MAAMDTLALNTLDILYGMMPTARPEEDTLSTQVVDNADVEWRFTTPDLWPRGTYGEYWKGTGVTGEIVYMTEDHPAAADVTVRRAQRQTSAESGAIAAGAVFLVDPLWPVVLVRRALTETIDNDLGPECFYRVSGSLTPVAGTYYYALDDKDFYVEDVYQYDLNSLTNFNPISRGLWEVETNLDAGVAASGVALRLFPGGWYDDSADVYYTVRRKPAVEDIASFPQEILDLVPWGAAARLLAMSAPWQRYDPARAVQANQNVSANQPYADATYFRGEFERMKEQYKRMLFREKMPRPVYRRHPKRVVRR